MSNEKNKPTAADILEESLVVDMVFPCGQDLESELAVFIEGGFAWISITVATDENAWPEQVLQRLSQHRMFYSKNPERFIMVDRMEDVLRAKAEKKLAISFNFQGTEPIGRNLSLIGSYYQLGVRSMLLSYNYQNNVGMGCLEAQGNDLGLTDFGCKVIAEMNRIGMVVDLSHTGHRTTMEAMERSTAPCIFSHSNAYALHQHPRNIKDDQILAVARTGGLIGINGVGAFVGELDVVSAETLFRHLDYMVQKVGPHHVALGLDYMSPACCNEAMAILKGDLSRVAMPSPPPWAVFNPGRLIELVDSMQNHGYDQNTIRAILGGNVLRLAETIWL